MWGRKMHNTSLINDLTLRIENEPQNPKLLHERCFAYLQDDYFDKAANDCSCALELDPENMDYIWMQNHIRTLEENAERIINNPENDIRIFLGSRYISLLTPNADGYVVPMEKIVVLREEMKNNHNIEVPVIRFLESDLITDSEIALCINKVIVWKYELKDNNLEDCETATLGELRKILRLR